MKMTHKNRSQMLARNKAFYSTLQSWRCQGGSGAVAAAAAESSIMPSSTSMPQLLPSQDLLALRPLIEATTALVSRSVGRVCRNLICSHLPCNLNAYPSVCLSTCLSVCLSVYLSVCLSVYLSVCLFVCLLVCLSVCLLVCSFFCWCFCLSVCVYVINYMYSNIYVVSKYFLL